LLGFSSASLCKKICEKTRYDACCCPAGLPDEKSIECRTNLSPLLAAGRWDSALFQLISRAAK
jgi:hypothetical protein